MAAVSSAVQLIALDCWRPVKYLKPYRAVICSSYMRSFILAHALLLLNIKKTRTGFAPTFSITCHAYSFVPVHHVWLCANKL